MADGFTVGADLQKLSPDGLERVYNRLRNADDLSEGTQELGLRLVAAELSRRGYTVKHNRLVRRDER